MDIITIADSATKAAVTEITKYTVNKVGEKLKEIYESKRIVDFSYEDLAERFNDYIIQSIEKYSAIPTIALRDRKVSIHEIYLPLTLKSMEKEFSKEKILVTEYNQAFFNKYPKMLIIDSAGMGKSTMLQFLFLSALIKKIGIPIFIELRGLKEGITILDVVYKKFNYLNENFKKEYLIDLIKKGDFIFFLDGYDEIPNSEKERVAIELRDFINNAGKNKFIITSRPIRSANFPDFDKFEIQRLSQDESFELISKYDDVTKLDLYQPLVASIKESGKGYIQFLENPLYISLLYLTFKRKRELPLTQAEYYKQVYEALYMEHDLTKDGAFRREKHSGLSMDQLNKFLSRLSYVSLMNNLNDFNSTQIINLIDKALDSLYFKKEIGASLLFTDLTENVPLFVRQGVNYKWIHKSFMEYFASNYISLNDKKNEILDYIKQHNEFDNFENMLNIYSDIDTQNFNKAFVKPLLEEFIYYMDNVDLPEDLQYFKKHIFGNIVFITRASNDLIEKIKLEIDQEKVKQFVIATLERRKDTRLTEEITEERINEQIGHRTTYLIDESISSEIYKQNSDMYRVFHNAINFYLENSDIIKVVSSKSVYYDSLMKILGRKEYEFIQELNDEKLMSEPDYAYFGKLLDDEEISGYISGLDLEKEVNYMLKMDKHANDTMINLPKKLLKVLLPYLSLKSNQYYIDYKIAKQYLEMLNKQEEKIADVLGLIE
ncbi:NACHT domain-containing protein [Priestia aryabhattai]|uniref:NACHT domain-containing protein n=1 Tax=Priestia aryabhattai TaxID=412384 RepID=UPI001875354E|nr:hypothetical protein [Priestia aryabhattai]MBE5103331.1 hypothetical protein [Priestia aryabhattai]